MSSTFSMLDALGINTKRAKAQMGETLQQKSKQEQQIEHISKLVKQFVPTPGQTYSRMQLELMRGVSQGLQDAKEQTEQKIEQLEQKLEVNKISVSQHYLKESMANKIVKQRQNDRLFQNGKKEEQANTDRQQQRKNDAILTHGPSCNDIPGLTA